MTGLRLVVLVMILFSSSGMLFGQSEIPDFSNSTREQVPDEHKWRIEDIFDSIEAWEAEKRKVVALMADMDDYVEGWSSTPPKLAALMQFMDEIELPIFRLIWYADLTYGMDMGNPELQRIRGEAFALLHEYNGKMPAFDEGIIALGEEELERYIRAEPSLGKYRWMFRRILRLKDHYLLSDAQQVTARYAPLTEVPTEVASILRDNDIPKAKVVLSDGEEYTLDYPTYARLSPESMEDRRLLRDAYLGNLKIYENAFAALLEAHFVGHIAEAKTRNYESSLEAVLDADAIEPAVYTMTIEMVRENIPLLHRYLKLKKRALGLDEVNSLNYWTPIVGKLKKTYTYDEARELLIESSAIAGPEFQAVMKKAFDEGWNDIYPHKGKKGFGGAADVYGVHPYVILNFTGVFHDVYVMTHELGHAVNFWFSNEANSFVDSQPSAMATEAAAMFNEQMLVDHLLRSGEDDLTKLFVLDKNVKGILVGIFAQAMYSEFELAAHRKLEAGEALNAEWLNSKFLELKRLYFGHEIGVCVIDDLEGSGWLQIKHFYMNYYLINYVWGKVASLALYNSVVNGGLEERQRYIDFLSAGGSDYTLEIMRRAGADMASRETYRAAFNELSKLLDEMETIVDRLAAEGKWPE